MVFYSGNFTFNNVHSRDMNISLVSFDSEVLNDYGISYNENIVAENINDKHFYYNSSKEISPVVLNLALVDENENALVWDFETRKNVMDWLITDTFCEFISEDNPELIYYFKCIGINKKFSSDMKGILEVTMQPQDEYAYSPIMNYIYEVNGEENINIYCLENATDKNFPIIQIIQHGQEDIEIINNSTYKEGLIIKNLDLNENMYIDNELKQIESSLKINRLSDINRKWFYLKRGLNNITIKGNCSIKFITQYRMVV